MMFNFENLSYEEKLELTKTKIIAFYRANKGNVALSYSGGKDSTVLEHIIRKDMGLDIPLIFSNTGNEHKEIYNFIKNKKEHYGDDLIIIRPEHAFRWTVHIYGYPIVSKEQAEAVEILFLATHLGHDTMRSVYTKWFWKDRIKVSDKALFFCDDKMIENLRKHLDKVDPEIHGDIDKLLNKIEKRYEKVRKLRDYFGIVDKKIKLTSKCCYILKKKPMSKFQKEHNNIGFIIGTRVEESNLRKTSFKRFGCWNKQKNTLTPLAWWTSEDIERYIRENKVQLSKAYQTEIRTGCVACGFGLTQDPYRFHRLRKYTPKRWKQLYNWKNIHSDISFGEALEIFENIINL